MPRKTKPRARLSAREKALMKAAKKVGSKTARARLKAILVEWCATPDAELPRVGEPDV